MNRLTQTDDNLASIFLRVSFAIMMIPHGAGKLFGAFGGFGFEKTMEIFMNHFHIPWILGLVAFLVEFFSAVALLVGWQTRINALLLAGVMSVAGYFHLEYGFYMNWFGKKAGEGFEFHILALGILLALVMIGGGKCSLDRKWMKKEEV